MEAEATAGRKREARAATLRSISSFYRGTLSLFVKDEGEQVQSCQRALAN